MSRLATSEAASAESGQMSINGPSRSLGKSKASHLEMFRSTRYGIQAGIRVAALVIARALHPPPDEVHKPRLGPTHRHALARPHARYHVFPVGP